MKAILSVVYRNDPDYFAHKLWVIYQYCIMYNIKMLGSCCTNPMGRQYDFASYISQTAKEYEADTVNLYDCKDLAPNQEEFIQAKSKLGSLNLIIINKKERKGGKGNVKTKTGARGKDKECPF